MMRIQREVLFKKANPGKSHKVAIEATKESLKELIAKYRPQLRSFIRKRVTNREDAEDILQDVFYKLVITVDNVLNPVENVSAWLYKVAHNSIINAGIKKKEETLPVYDEEEEDDVFDNFSEVLFQDDPKASSPEREYLRSLVWTELEDALSELPPEQREIFEQTELNGIPVKDISKITGIPVNTLLSRKHYAVLHLRARLADLYQDIIYS